MSERIISSKDGIIIEDLRIKDKSKWLNIVTADLFDPSIGESASNKLLFKTATDFNSENTTSRIIEHVRTVSSILAQKGGHISNIKLFNLTSEEAEEKGFLHPPAIIEHHTSQQ